MNDHCTRWRPFLITCRGYPRVVDLLIRAARRGDGEALARCWLEMGRYYTALDRERFQVPNERGLIEWVEAQLAEGSATMSCDSLRRSKAV